jgi:hypothetical protein
VTNQIAIGVAYQDQAISAGSIDGSPIGATTPSTGMFSSLGISTAPSQLLAAPMPTPAPWVTALFW